MVFGLLLAAHAVAGCGNQGAGVPPDAPTPGATGSGAAEDPTPPEPSPAPSATIPSLPPTPTGGAAVSGTGWQAFDLDQIIERQLELGQSYRAYLDEPSMSFGLYALEAGASDPQSPHRRDEVYYVVEGLAILEIDGDEVPVSAGSIAFVRGGVPHRFQAIEADLRTVVLFSNVPSDPAADAWLTYELDTLREAAREDSNVWHRFLGVPTMRFGLYLLPAEVGGDTTLTHTFDELNLVVRGLGIFQIGDQSIEVSPGKVIFVEAGVDHSFHSIQEDLEVLILFEGGA